MKKLIYSVALGIVCLTAPSAASAEEIFIAHLNGAAEVPPNVTDAIGIAVITINEAGDTISFFVAFDSLQTNAVDCHIHHAPPGQDGAILFPLTTSVPADTSGAFFGTLTAANFTPQGGVNTFAKALSAIRRGGTYLNVHTSALPGGEIRGQVRTYDGP